MTPPRFTTAPHPLPAIRPDRTEPREGIRHLAVIRTGARPHLVGALACDADVARALDHAVRRESAEAG